MGLSEVKQELAKEMFGTGVYLGVRAMMENMKKFEEDEKSNRQNTDKQIQSNDMHQSKTDKCSG